MPIPAAAATAGAQAMQGVAQGIGAGMQAKASKYGSKKQAKENKRKTLADLLNEALKREYEAGQSTRKSQMENRTQQAQVLQNLANQYIQALR